MASFNSVQLIGNLTRDPEVRYTPKGAAVAEFSLAINRKYKAESGEQREEVTFVDCTAWAKTAELIGQYCKKGNPLFVTGRLTTDSWEDKQTGQKRSKMKVTVENMQFLGGKDGERAEKPQQTTASGGYRKANVPPASSAADDFESEPIPF